MSKYIKYLLLVVFILNKISCGFTDFSKDNNIDLKLMMKLIEKISELERNVTKLEKNEKQMMESIRALIQTNAQSRLATMELQKRLTNVETEMKDNVSKELADRLKNLEEESKEKEHVINNLVERLEYLKEGDYGSCVKSRIPPCSEEKGERLGVLEKADGGKCQP